MSATNFFEHVTRFPKIGLELLLRKSRASWWKKTVDVDFGGSAYVHFAVGDRRNRELYGVACCVAIVRGLRTAVEQRRMFSRIIGIQYRGTGSWPGRTILSTVDRPNNCCARCRSIRGNRRRGPGESKHIRVARNVREIRESVYDRNRLQYISASPEIQIVVPIRRACSTCHPRQLIPRESPCRWCIPSNSAGYR